METTETIGELPTHWYSAVPDLPRDLPDVIDPETREPVGEGYLDKLFVSELARREFSRERFLPIPNELREVYSIWRPTPLVRAHRLERELNTPAKIYYKNEAVSPSGSHKPNTAVVQAYYAREEGVDGLITNTTAGQWGSALALGCSIFDLKSRIYMARAAYKQKPYRKTLMEVWGGEVFESPSDNTEAGRELLEEDPEHPGSIGIAKAEAIEDAMRNQNLKHAVGSVMNFVLANQTVIGQEAKTQLEEHEDYPDTVIGCVGGGSNFSGLFWPFYHDLVAGKAPNEIEFIAAESSASPRLTQGEYVYDHGDTMRQTPLFKMYTVGHTYVPPPIHTGGLRVHGVAPTLSILLDEGIVEPRAYDQIEVFEAAMLFARKEGTLPAPESAHAIKAVIEEAREAKREGEERVILYNQCGHGLLDMTSYQEYLEGQLEPNDADIEEVEESLKTVKNLYPWTAQE